MLVTVFVFLGIEGASVYSRYAKKRSDVGVATVVGFLGVLCVLVLVTMLSYAVMRRPDLAALRNPSMAGVLEAVVGRWGAIFVSAGLIISVLGAYLSWTLLAAEVLFSAAENETMPTVARPSKRELGSRGRPVADQYRGAGISHSDTVCAVCLYPRPGTYEFHDSDPFLFGRGICREAGVDGRDVRRGLPASAGAI